MNHSPYIQYEKLPDSIQEEKTPVGKRLILLSLSSKGEIHDPLTVNNPLMAEHFFGEGPLLDLYESARKGNENVNIMLMRTEEGKWQEALLALESYEFDFLSTNLFFADDEPDYIQSFIHLAQRKEHHGQLIHGFFSVKNHMSESDKANLNAQISRYKIEMPYFDEVDEQGKYLSFVVDQLNEYHAAGFYAGFITSFDSEISPVNKEMNGVSLKKEFSNGVLRELSSMGLVVFRDSFHHGPIVSSSSTAVQTEGSPHRHIANFRIAQELINLLALSFEQFIGQARNDFILEKIEEEIAFYLSKFKRLDKIKSQHEYSVSKGQDIHSVNVEISVVPIFSAYEIISRSIVSISG